MSPALTVPAAPEGTDLVLDVLRAALPGGVVVVSSRPADYAQHVPLVHAQVIPGGRDVHPRFLYTAVVSVDAYSANASDASALSESVRRALQSVWSAQSIHAGGSVSSVVTTQWPSQMRDPDLPSGLARYHAKHTLSIRRQT